MRERFIGLYISKLGFVKAYVKSVVLIMTYQLNLSLILIIA